MENYERSSQGYKLTQKKTQKLIEDIKDRTNFYGGRTPMMFGFTFGITFYF